LTRSSGRGRVGRIVFAIAALAMAAFPTGAGAMALFGANVLFSAVSGTVLRDGAPVAGAEIVRKVTTRDTRTDTAATDSRGRFDMPQVSASKGLVDLLPAEFVAGQELTIRVGGPDYPGWIYTKRDPANNAESNGRPFRLVCEISAEPGYTDNYYGICKLIAD
jgi:hypothetical protein